MGETEPARVDAGAAQFRYYPYVMAAFVAILLLSNIIGASKPSYVTLPGIGQWSFGAGVLSTRSYGGGVASACLDPRLSALAPATSVAEAAKAIAATSVLVLIAFTFVVQQIWYSRAYQSFMPL